MDEQELREAVAELVDDWYTGEVASRVSVAPDARDDLKERIAGFVRGEQAEVERLRAANQRLESYLNQIAGSAQEWDCNKLGGVNIQRKRWQRLGELARTALRR